MILTWNFPFSKASYQAMPLKRLAPHIEKELGVFDDEWLIRDDKLIFNPCLFCLVPWISTVRLVTYDIVVNYDIKREKLQFKFRLYKLYVVSIFLAIVPLLLGDFLSALLAYVGGFLFWFLVFYLELLFRKAGLRDCLDSILKE